MGIDGIEFHTSYHQNLGTFQEVWLFQIFLVSNFTPHPLVQPHLQNTIGNPFFLLQGVQVSSCHEDNSWLESVGQVESVEKS